jgi:hypothetical protein
MANEWDVVSEAPVSEWDVVSTAPVGPPPTGRVAELMRVPTKTAIGPAEHRAWAEQQAAKEQEVQESEGGVMGAIRKALGVAEVAISSITSPVGYVAGMLGGGSQFMKAGLAKTFGQDQLAGEFAADVEPAFERGQAEFTYAPRTEEGRDIAAGPVMREINNAMSALGPTGAVAINPRAVLGGAGHAARAVGDVRRAATDNAAAAVTPTIAPGKLGLATKAIDEGIPLRPDMLTSSKLAKMAGEAAEQVPFSGGRKEQRTKAFNAAVARMIDPEGKAEKLTPEVYDRAMAKAGEEIGAISERTDVPREAFGNLTDVARRETPDVKNVIQTYADDLVKIADENGGAVPGVELRKLRSEANSQMRTTANGDLRRTLASYIKKLDDALSEHAPEGDMLVLAEARKRYAIGIALEPLVAKTTTGDISPAALMGRATATGAGKRRMARGRGGDMGDYAKIGQEFLKEQASSGTAERNLVYKMATDAATAAKAVSLYPFAAAYNLMGPRVAKWMVDRANKRAGASEEAAQPRPELTLAEAGAPIAPERPAQPGPLGDLTPERETTPGAAPPAGALEVVPTEGLVRAVDEPNPTRAGPQVRRNPGSDIPAVPGRPDLPDTMVAGAPAEIAGTPAMGAATLAPGAQVAMQSQRAARAGEAAAAERAAPVPKGEATEIKPEVIQPAEAPKTSPRLTEVERLMVATDSPVAKKALEERAVRIKKELKEEADAQQRRDDAAELRRVAALTADPEIKAALFEKAKAIEKAEAIPVGETAEGQPEIKPAAPKKIPVGKTKELENAPGEVSKQEGLQQKRGEGDEGGQAAEAGAGDSVQREAKGKAAGGEGETLADLGSPRSEEAFFEHQQRAQRRAEPAPAPVEVERGRRQTRKALEKGIADGSLSKDEGSLALWALDKNPNLARGLRTSVSGNTGGDIARAVYKTSERVVEIFKNRESTPDRAAHEILHHSERMMPPEVQRGIRREWRRALEAEMKSATPEVRAALKSIEDGIAGGGKEAFEAMKKAFKDGVLDRDKHYHLTNPSEFWAVNASRILNERFTGRNSWRAEAVRWLKEMIEHVKSTVGLRSDAAVLKALNDLLDVAVNKGVDRSPTTLKTAESQAAIASSLAQRMRERKRQQEPEG